MQLVISRDLLLQAINLISKAADKRHNMVILGNMKLALTDSHQDGSVDLELELQATPQFASIGVNNQVKSPFLPTNSKIS